MASTDSLLDILRIRLHDAVAGSDSYSDRESEHAERYEKVLDAFFLNMDYYFRDAEEAHHHKEIIGHLRVLHHSDRAVEHHQGYSPAIFLSEDQIEASYHRSHHSEGQGLCFVSCGNDKEEIRGHRNSDGAYYTQPFIDPEGPHHNEEAQEIPQKECQNRVGKECSEFSEESVYSPDSPYSGVGRVFYGNLIAGHSAKHGVGPVCRGLGCSVVFLQFVGHTLPLKVVALTENLTLNRGPAIDKSQGQKHQSSDQVGAVFFEKLFHLFIFALSSAGLAHR